MVCVFDLLVQADKSVIQLPLVERKKRLAKVLAGDSWQLYRCDRVRSAATSSKAPPSRRYACAGSGTALMCATMRTLSRLANAVP